MPAVEGTQKSVTKGENMEPFTIYKADEDKHLVFGWASVSIKVDGQELIDRQQDMIDPEDLEEAAYEYVLNFRDTGEEHLPGYRKKGKLVESCVFTKEKQRAMGIPEGILPIAWWIGFKIEDEDTWQRVKNGTYKMFSIEGKAHREPVEKADQVAKTFEETLEKFNPYHGYHGHFASANSATSFTYKPGQGKMYDMAIQREKDRLAAGGAAIGSGSETKKPEEKPKDYIGNTEQQKHHPESVMEKDSDPDSKFFKKVKGEAIDEMAESFGISRTRAKELCESIQGFSDGDYHEIRKAGRGDSGDKDYKREAANCDEFIERSPKWAGGKLYRGQYVEGEEKVQAMIDAAWHKKPLDLRGASSWSSDKETAESFGGNYKIQSESARTVMFVTNGKSTNRGTSIKHISEHPSEDEVLVHSKATFNPTRVKQKDGVIYIYGDIV